MTLAEYLRKNSGMRLTPDDMQRLQSVMDDIASRNDSILKRATPQKGVDYSDGANGKDGIDGLDGMDGADGLPGADGKDGRDGIDGKDGKDGRDGRDGVDGKDADEERIIQSVLSKIGKTKKLTIADIDDLEPRLISISTKHHGGQGETKTLSPTTSDNQTYTFKPTPLKSELAIYRGGARQFLANGDYTLVEAAGGRVTSITLNTALAPGELINFLGKL